MTSLQIEKLRVDVEEHGLGVIVIGEWYHEATMRTMRFFDDNTRSWWTPATGGGNIPALNDLLAPYGIAFGDTILTGLFSISGERAQYSSGTDLRRFPAGGFVHRFLFHDTTGHAEDTIIHARGSAKSQVRHHSCHNSLRSQETPLEAYQAPQRARARDTYLCI